MASIFNLAVDETLQEEPRTTYDELRERTGPAIRVTNPHDLIPHLQIYAHRRKEYLLGVYLDSAQQVLAIRVISIGTLGRTLCHPREFYQPALQVSAASVILVHNHPSGNTEPSREDRDMVKRIADAGKILGVALLDSLIIAPKSYFSFVEAGEL